MHNAHAIAIIKLSLEDNLEIYHLLKGAHGSFTPFIYHTSCLREFARYNDFRWSCGVMELFRTFKEEKFRHT